MLKFFSWKRCIFSSQVLKEQSVLVDSEATKPVLAPFPIHLPLVQAEEERVGSVFLRRASSSQALGQRRRGVPRLLVQHLGFYHMVPVLPRCVWSDVGLHNNDVPFKDLVFGRILVAPSAIHLATLG